MKNNTEISERISLMLNTLNVKPNSFAKVLKYERSQTIYDIINGKSAPSYDFFYRFLMSEYSVLINIYWLITGNGEMLISSKKSYEHLYGLEVNEDTSSIYSCKLCNEKDKRLDALERIIKTQSEFIDSLKKEKCLSPDEQKRKVG